MTVPGALTDDGDESEDVDLIAGDEAITLTIPVPIELSISPAPKLLDVNDDFLAQFGLTPDQNPEGFMFYYPPEPRTHTYTITATADGNPVSDFNLIVVDNVSQFTPDPAQEQAIFVEGTEGEYTVTAGLPNAVPDPC